MRVRTNLNLILLNKGYSRHRLARETGTTYSIMQGIVAGQRVPTNAELLEICRVLQCTDDLLYPDPDTRRVLAEVSA